MAANTTGFYFDRFRVLIAGRDLGGQPGNILALSVSRDGGLSWVDGFSQNHLPSGVLLANKHVIFRITENLQYNSTPTDFSAIDYDNSPVDIVLIQPTSQYGSNVYAGGNPYILKKVAWSNDQMAASYAANVKRDLEFFVTAGDFWLSAQ